jgi:hypothetical protein
MVELDDLVGSTAPASVRTLAKGWSPFKYLVWDDLSCPITRAEVRAQCLLLHYDPPTEPRGRHAWWIAHYAKRGWTNPVEIDVGVPALNCWVNWIVTDGNHRVAAAILRRDRTIVATIGGDIDYACDLGLVS